MSEPSCIYGNTPCGGPYPSVTTVTVTQYQPYPIPGDGTIPLAHSPENLIISAFIIIVFIITWIIIYRDPKVRFKHKWGKKK